MNIIYVRSHPVNPEPRLEKEAKTMRNAGHNIWILGWRRYGNAPLSEGDDNYSISRFGLKAPIGKKLYCIGLSGGFMKQCGCLIEILMWFMQLILTHIFLHYLYLN